MAHWEKAPDPRLAPFVEALAFSNDEGEPDPPRRIPIAPDGGLDWIFSLPTQGDPVPCAHVFGIKTRTLWVEPEVPTEKLAVRFRPGAAARLLAVSAHELTDRGLSMEELPRNLAAEAWSELTRADDWATRAAAVEAALRSMLERCEPDATDRLVAVGVAEIERHGGNVRIEALAQHCGVNERRLERAFRTRVGVSPKRLARIVRFRWAQAALATGASQVEVAWRCGYADQPHLLREQREFAGAGQDVSETSKPSG